MREDLAVSMEFGVGSVLEGKVTGITKFGAFVSLPEGKSGLVHISEIAYSYVNDVKDHLKEGQEVKVKVIGIDENGRINLSPIKKTMDPPPRPQAGPSWAAPAGTGGGFTASRRRTRRRRTGSSGSWPPPDGKLSSCPIGAPAPAAAR